MILILLTSNIYIYKIAKKSKESDLKSYLMQIIIIFCKPTSEGFSKTRNFLHMAQQKQLNFFITLTIIFEFHFCWLGRIHMFSYSSYFISVSKEFTDVEVEELISFISLSFWRFNFLSFLRLCFLVHRQLKMQTWYSDL